MAYTIAPSNAPLKAKLSADFVCDGIDDQVEIMAALSFGNQRNQRVVCLDGNFVCSDSVEFPVFAPDFMFDAEMTRFDFSHPTHDCFIIHGGSRSIVKLGHTVNAGSGANVLVNPTTYGWSSSLSMRGGWGTNRQGYGLRVLAGIGASICDYTIGGLSGFDKAVSFEQSAALGTGGIDGTQVNLIYVRDSNICINEQCADPGKINTVQWQANIEATNSGDIGIKTNACYGQWNAIVYGAPGSTILQLDSGATGNQFGIATGSASFPGATFIQNNSGNTTNMLNGAPIV